MNIYRCPLLRYPQKFRESQTNMQMIYLYWRYPPIKLEVTLSISWRIKVTRSTKSMSPFLDIVCFRFRLHETIYYLKKKQKLKKLIVHFSTFSLNITSESLQTVRIFFVRVISIQRPLLMKMKAKQQFHRDVIFLIIIRPCIKVQLDDRSRYWILPKDAI